MKVINFSRKFPQYHPKKGTKTFFPEYILIGFGVEYWEKDKYKALLMEIPFNKGKELLIQDFVDSLTHPDHLPNTVIQQKRHTIRNGFRFMVGQFFSPRIWSGKPYTTPQIQFYTDIEVLKIWSFEVIVDDIDEGWYIDDMKKLSFTSKMILSWNDGLKYEDMSNWFCGPMTGQIICWNKDVSYPFKLQ